MATVLKRSHHVYKWMLSKQSKYVEKKGPANLTQAMLMSGSCDGDIHQDQLQSSLSSLSCKNNRNTAWYSMNTHMAHMKGKVKSLAPIFFRYGSVRPPHPWQTRESMKSMVSLDDLKHEAEQKRPWTEWCLQPKSATSWTDTEVMAQGIVKLQGA